MVSWLSGVKSADGCVAGLGVPCGSPYGDVVLGPTSKCATSAGSALRFHSRHFCRLSGVRSPAPQIPAGWRNRCAFSPTSMTCGVCSITRRATEIGVGCLSCPPTAPAAWLMPVHNGRIQFDNALRVGPPAISNRIHGRIKFGDVGCRFDGVQGGCACCQFLPAHAPHAATPNFQVVTIKGCMLIPVTVPVVEFCLEFCHDSTPLCCSWYRLRKILNLAA